MHGFLWFAFKYFYEPLYASNYETIRGMSSNSIRVHQPHQYRLFVYQKMTYTYESIVILSLSLSLSFSSLFLSSFFLYFFHLFESGVKFTIKASR